MPRKSNSKIQRANRRRDARRNTPDPTVRLIASQIQRLDDVTVYMLSVSLEADRETRELAESIAHQRAERAALSAGK